ncbi:MAG: hypothetical protein IKA29_00290, partial [Clostridia bacterium]|nr:hypothetical protein [Clostridia bacterium]
LAPIFIFAVGFASWTIVTPEFGFITNGSFVGNQLLDSTKYISLSDDNQAFTATTTVGGFITKDGTITNKTTLGVKFNIELGQCQTLFNSESGGDLYFTFALCFADRMESTLFNVDNFDVAVKLGGKEITSEQAVEVPCNLTESTGVTAIIQSIKAEGSDTLATELATSSTYVFVLKLHFPAYTSALTSVAKVELSLDYTLTPQSAEHYRTLMDIVFGADGMSKSLMSDVRITDYEPFATK